MKEELTMSKKERKRLQIIASCKETGITIEECAETLEISERQMYRILSRWKSEGDKGLIHRSRGKESNRGYPLMLKETVLSIYWKKYRDFGPTLFGEKLEECDGIKIDHETLRRWMRQNGIITNERQKRPHKKRRERRSATGSMIQLDGSHHDWFEGRAPSCCLLNIVDDATGRVHLMFSPVEDTESVMRALWGYCLKYGIPSSIYTDRHSVYYEENGITDFGRAMKKLQVQTIYARSPQAKGRVERGNRTHQDRLVKEMRLRNISSIDAGNKFLEEQFTDNFNKKFMVEPLSADIHRSIAGVLLEQVFCFEKLRQVKNDYTFSIGSIHHQIERSAALMPHPGDNVILREYLDKSTHAFNQVGEELVFRKLKERKKLNSQNRNTFPATNHPWRR